MYAVHTPVFGNITETITTQNNQDSSKYESLNFPDRDKKPGDTLNNLP